MYVTTSSKKWDRKFEREEGRTYRTAWIGEREREMILKMKEIFVIGS